MANQTDAVDAYARARKANEALHAAMNELLSAHYAINRDLRGIDPVAAAADANERTNDACVSNLNSAYALLLADILHG